MGRRWRRPDLAVGQGRYGGHAEALPDDGRNGQAYASLESGAGTATGQARANNLLASIAAVTKPVRSFGGVTIGPSFTRGLAVAAVCTAARNLVVQASDGSQISVPVVVGFNQFGVTASRVASETATCNFIALR